MGNRILIIGVGSIGERHVRCFQATGRATLSIVEVNEPLRKEVAARYAVREFESLDAALAQTPAVAVVAVPAHLHIPVATRLISAGIHVLIEKPLSTSLEGTASLLELARERNATVGVAYVLRAVPALAAMREAVVSGRFGRPVQIVAVGGQHFPTYRPAYRDIYYKSRATGGGAIQDALTHVVNAGEWLVGPVDRLIADAAHQVLPDVTVEDTVHVLARHGTVLGCYSLNQHQAPNETTITVVCERGTVRYEHTPHRWMWMTEPGENWHEETIGRLERDTIFIAQANAFLDAVERGERPACTLQEGLQTLRVNLAALASLDSRGWESITP